MANNTSTFVSPGVYTREVDLSFVTSSVGITTLGLVGETLKGPAFEPIFISNKNEYFTRFGAQSTEKFTNGIPKYEASYIANSYLEESNQLYVTRILGLTGFNAGKAWILKLNAGIDTTTFNTVVTTGTTNFTGNTSTFSNAVINNLKSYVGTFPITAINSGSTFTVSTGSTLTKTGTAFSASALTITVDTFNTDTTGTATYSMSATTATSLSAYEDMVIGVIRSRASYDDETLVFNTSGLTISSGATSNALAEFTLTSDTDEYIVSLDSTKQNFISKVIGVGAKDKDADIYVEDIYSNLLTKLIGEGKVYGIKSTLTTLTDIGDYATGFKTPETPWIVSQIKGNKIEQLFKFILISDGNDANKEIKISIENINFDTKEFDVIIRNFDDIDGDQGLEAYRRCSMNPQLNTFIGKRIGTSNGDYKLFSKYVMVEVSESASIDSLPAGFEGFAVRNYTGVLTPEVAYKTSYDFNVDRVKKAYLGITNLVGIDQTMFNFLGNNISTGKTKGFHMDSGATQSLYQVGDHSFKSEADVVGTDYEKINARKFTVVAAGGFDGWDIFRNNRTNTDDYRKGQPKFSGFTNTLASDYYAYLNGIRTFANPSDVAINLFATANIDYDRHNALVKETIEMIEDERADSLYIVTTPEQPDSSDSAQSMVDILDAADIDSNYTTTFAPWIQHEDSQNGSNIYLPPTFEVVRNFAETDNKFAPWFATGGFTRGQLKSKKALIKINQDSSDILYDGRINPIRSYPQSPLLIMGNKNLQIKDSALNRNNVRRLLLQVRKLVSAVAVKLVFEPNDAELQSQFLYLVNPIMETVKKQRGLIDYKVICDSSINNADTRDRLELKGRILLKPTLSAEYIEVEFGVTDQGASFTNI